MNAAHRPIRSSLATILICGAALWAQRGGGAASSQQLEERLKTQLAELEKTPDSLQALRGAGTTLDLLGRGKEARTYFQKAIDAAPSAQAKSQAQRDMANSYGFEGDCKNSAKYLLMVVDYWKTQEAASPGN